MHRQYLMPAAAVAVASVLGTSAMRAQEFPARPVRIITYAPGGGTDFLSRAIAHGLGVSPGWQVIVDNRAGGVIQGELLARATPDGHTLLLNGNSLWLAPFMQSKVPYDPDKDFAPVILAASSPNLLVVHPSLPAKSVTELVALAKAKPGELNYASNATGGSAHLAAELFRSLAGVDIVRVNYKGGGPALNDLIGGRVQLMFPVVAAGVPHVKSGRLRALAVTSAQPSALLPGFPTVAAAGLAGYETVTLYGMFVPRRTPAAVVVRLNQEIAGVISSPEVKEKFHATGVEPGGGPAEQLAATMKSDMARMGRVIRNAGIRAE